MVIIQCLLIYSKFRDTFLYTPWFICVFVVYLENIKQCTNDNTFKDTLLMNCYIIFYGMLIIQSPLKLKACYLNIECAKK